MSKPEFAMEASASSEPTRSVPLETAGSAKEVADRIRQGRSVLEIVSTPWGVEFYVRDIGVVP